MLETWKCTTCTKVNAVANPMCVVCSRLRFPDDPTAGNVERGGAAHAATDCALMVRQVISPPCTQPCCLAAWPHPHARRHRLLTVATAGLAEQPAPC